MWYVSQEIIIPDLYWCQIVLGILATQRFLRKEKTILKVQTIIEQILLKISLPWYEVTDCFWWRSTPYSKNKRSISSVCAFGNAVSPTYHINNLSDVYHHHTVTIHDSLLQYLLRRREVHGQQLCDHENLQNAMQSNPESVTTWINTVELEHVSKKSTCTFVDFIFTFASLRSKYLTTLNAPSIHALCNGALPSYWENVLEVLATSFSTCCCSLDL